MFSRLSGLEMEKHSRSTLVSGYESGRSLRSLPSLQTIDKCVAQVLMQVKINFKLYINT